MCLCAGHHCRKTQADETSEEDAKLEVAHGRWAHLNVNVCRLPLPLPLPLAACRCRLPLAAAGIQCRNPETPPGLNWWTVTAEIKASINVVV